MSTATDTAAPSEDSPASAQSPGSPRCVDCKHGEQHYTHLTGCVVCKYPRERVPRVVDKSLLRLGRWCVPNNTAQICPHFDGKRWKSCAKWPPECCPSIGNYSEDTHDTKEAAESVCRLLGERGFGGDGKYFPVLTWTEPVE